MFHFPKGTPLRLAGKNKELSAEKEEKSELSKALPILGVMFVIGAATTFVVRNATN